MLRSGVSQSNANSHQLTPARAKSRKRRSRQSIQAQENRSG